MTGFIRMMSNFTALILAIILMTHHPSRFSIKTKVALTITKTQMLIAKIG